MTNNENMKESVFHTNDYYESYVLGRLSEPEEGLFEEHMLTCDHCREQLEITEPIIFGIKTQRESEQNKFKPLHARRNKPLLIKISAAATVILLIGFSIFYLNTSKDRKKGISSSQEKLADTTTNKAYTENDPSIKVTEPEITQKNNNNVQLAEAYKPLPLFENAIENYVRSGTLEILNPSISAEIKAGDTLTFEWKNNTDALFLIIFDNTGEIIFEKRANPPFLFKKELKNGLYYWQLENADESLFTGKFFINR